MAADHTPPRDPDRRWAHPLIALLVLASAWLVFWRVTAERHLKPPMQDRISTQARLIELRHSTRSFGHFGAGRYLPAAPLEQLARTASSAWDRGLYALLAAEGGDLKLGKTLAMEGPRPEGTAGEAFRRCFAAAYLSQGTAPEDRTSVSRALGNGYASKLLEARLVQPSQSAILKEAARRWALPRLAALAAAGMALMILVPSGLAVAGYLAMAPRPAVPAPLPGIRATGCGLAIAFLGWFLAVLLSGPLVASIVAIVPVLGSVSLPLTYLLHASAGIALLAGQEGLSASACWKRFFPGDHLKSLAWGFGFLALAALMVLGISLLVGPWLRQQESPQQELMDLVAGATGAVPVGLLFLTVAVVAPCFEECLFRGTLLSWLDARLGSRMGAPGGRAAALLLSSLAFGAIHLQPVALPVLSVLGLALGLAFLRTRNLLTPILVHALWNGSVFLFYRLVLG